MKRMFSVFLLITVWLLVTPFLQAQSHVDKVLKDEITSDLKENILSFWERYSVDSSGGFYGSLGRDCYLYARNKKRIQDIRVTPDLEIGRAHV